jgi:hypothetical protein
MTTIQPLPRTLAAISIAGLLFCAGGCKEQTKTEAVKEKTETTAKEAGDAVKDAANKTGKAVETTAEKVWDEVKHGAHQVSKVATNVAGDVKKEAEKVGDKLK